MRNISGTVHGQLQAAQDVASSVAVSASNQLKDVQDVALSNLDKGIDAASQGLKSATSAAIFGTQQAATQTRVCLLDCFTTSYHMFSSHLLFDTRPIWQVSSAACLLLQIWYDTLAAQYQVAEEHIFRELKGR